MTAEMLQGEPDPSTRAVPVGPTPAQRLREVGLLFLRLGFTAFGGPAAHVAMMEDEFVRRRKWLDRRHFLDVVSALNFIPGPNSTELAIHLGLLRAGLPGLVVAGICFILPAAAIVLALAWAYVSYGRLPEVQGVLQLVNAVVVAVLAVAVWRLGRTAVRDRFTAAIGVSAVAAAAAFARQPALGWQPELVILAAAALLGAAWYAGRRGGGTDKIDPDPDGNTPAPPASPPAALRTSSSSAAAVGASLPTVASVGSAAAGSAAPGYGAIGWFFLKVGATLFGSGYVLVNYLQSGLVDRRPAWLTQQELIDAVAVGQVTPGPLLTTATFIGYVMGHRHIGGHAAGVAGGLVATAAIFLPAFVLVALFGRLLPRLRRNPWARGALDGMNAAVAGLILVVTARLGTQLADDPVAVGAALVAAAALLCNVNSTWLILAAAGAGWGRHLLLGP